MFELASEYPRVYRALLAMAMGLTFWAAASTALGEGFLMCVCREGGVSLEVACDPAQCCPAAGAETAAGPDGQCASYDATPKHVCIDVPMALQIEGFNGASRFALDAPQRPAAARIGMASHDCAIEVQEPAQAQRIVELSSAPAATLFSIVLLI